jgi:hypothetical protein
VPNYSFENYITCPYHLTKPPPPPWYNACESVPTYCNACCTDVYASVPYNATKGTSYQYARTGGAYVFLDYVNGPTRTYVQVKLNDDLKKDKYYYCKHYVNSPNPERFICNNVAMLFTDTAILSDPNKLTTNPILASPQIVNYGNPVIGDTLNWIKVSGVFKAKGGEQYLTLGNFKSNANTITKQIVATGYNGAGYYIDDVSVIPLDSMPLQADAGKDTAIYAGDSVFIGSYTNGIDTIQWQNQNIGTAIDSTRPGFWVKPTQNTCYILTQIVNGYTSSDTMCVTIKTLPLLIKNYELKISNQKQLENIWTTANEVNVSHYNIQRSINGKDFATIGTVKANNKASNEYEYIDGIRYWELGVSKLYYRVVGVDDDGRKTYSEARTLNFKPQTLNGISVYPNPSKDVVHITGENIKEVKIINCLGQQIATGRNLRNDAIIINTTNFNKGLYIVQVLLVNGKVYNEKLIVQ